MAANLMVCERRKHNKTSVNVSYTTKVGNVAIKHLQLKICLLDWSIF